ncbi:MAG: hypothetical protein KA369_20305 [Spirochaetes bacterium]|nr:hypothetical protein [Spirochaetota bacterium]
MFIDTTIYIHVNTLRKIADISRKTCLSRREIISWLICKMAGADLISAVPFSRVRYQDRDRKERWKRVHVTLSPAEYELLLDMRKVYKLSASGIIAYAVEIYIVKLLDIKNMKNDNYRFSCYIFSRFEMGGVICWAQYWGMPRGSHAISGLLLPVNNNVPLRGS